VVRNSLFGLSFLLRFFHIFLLFLAQQPNAGQGHIMLEVSRSHAITYHSRQNVSGWGIGPSQKPLPDNTEHSQQTDIHAPGGIFFVLSVLYPYFYVLIVLAFASVLIVHHTQHKLPCSRRDSNTQPQLEPATPASDRPQILALGRSATVIGNFPY
jgi:hypothetical protein